MKKPNNKVESLFSFEPPNNEEPYATYFNLRNSNHEKAKKIRNFINKCWPIYKPYADNNFAKRFPKEFSSRFWEMYLTCTLLNLNSQILHKEEHSGPDILLEQNSKKIWIEAIAPKRGDSSNPDSVPEIKLKTVQKVPDEQIILRLGRAIKEKIKGHSYYLKSKIVDEGDSYIIAVNGLQIPFSRSDTRPPRILKVLFPIGNRIFTVNRNTMEFTDSGYEHRVEIKREKAPSYSTEIFSKPGYENLSAVLFSNIGPGYLPDKMGMDFILIHNPLTKNPLPEGLIKTGQEWFAKETDEDYELTCKNWNDSD